MASTTSSLPSLDVETCLGGRTTTTKIFDFDEGAPSIRQSFIVGCKASQSFWAQPIYFDFEVDGRYSLTDGWLAVDLSVLFCAQEKGKEQGIFVLINHKIYEEAEPFQLRSDDEEFTDGEDVITITQGRFSGKPLDKMQSCIFYTKAETVTHEVDEAIKAITVASGITSLDTAIRYFFNRNKEIFKNDLLKKRGWPAAAASYFNASFASGAAGTPIASSSLSPAHLVGKLLPYAYSSVSAPTDEEQGIDRSKIESLGGGQSSLKDYKVQIIANVDKEISTLPITVGKFLAQLKENPDFVSLINEYPDLSNYDKLAMTQNHSFLDRVLSSSDTVSIQTDVTMSSLIGTSITASDETKGDDAGRKIRYEPEYEMHRKTDFGTVKIAPYTF